ncbi:MAG: hypothetical protein H7Y22_06300 [Gemmatimonadaceae bacterium]|nr:hypothetical protein [Gloeobacterales cyanobacterium ES-bin-141]
MEPIEWNETNEPVGLQGWTDEDADELVSLYGRFSPKQLEDAARLALAMASAIQAVYSGLQDLDAPESPF